MDLETLIEDRVESILMEEPDIYAEYAILEDEGTQSEWGIISLVDVEGRALRFEVLETEISWMREEAVDQYNEIADEGAPVLVVVPDEAFLAMSERLKKYGTPDVSLTSYGTIMEFA